MGTAAEIEPTSKTKPLPLYRVVLHNDPVNIAEIVVQRIVEFTRLPQPVAEARTLEAHTSQISVLLVTHKERAELIQEQFSGCSPPITVTIEPD